MFRFLRAKPMAYLACPARWKRTDRARPQARRRARLPTVALMARSTTGPALRRIPARHQAASLPIDGPRLTSSTRTIDRLRGLASVSTSQTPGRLCRRLRLITRGPAACSGGNLLSHPLGRARLLVDSDLPLQAAFHSEANGGDGVSTSDCSDFPRAALIRWAVAAYQGSFSKFSLRDDGFDLVPRPPCRSIAERVRTRLRLGIYPPHTTLVYL
jgi:hypothetical protein